MSVSLPADPRLPDFTIAVPANWYTLDLDPRTRAATIAALVEQRFGGNGSAMVRQVRRELTETLRGYARQAASRGAIYAALMDRVVEGVAISASLVIAVGDAPRDRTGAPVLDPDALGQALVDSEQVGTDASEPPDRDTVHTLAGAAVRLRRTTSAGPTGRDGLGVATAESQYFLPVPGTDKVLAMTFATPNLPVRAALDEMFDAIAHTLDWVWDNERAPV